MKWDFVASDWYVTSSVLRKADLFANDDDVEVDYFKGQSYRQMTLQISLKDPDEHFVFF